MRSRRPTVDDHLRRSDEPAALFFRSAALFFEMDRQKYKVVAGSMERAFGMQRKKNVSESPPPWTPNDRQGFRPAVHCHAVKEFVGKEIEENFDELYSKIADDFEIEAGENEVVIRMMGESTFDSGKAEIKPELKPLILRIGEILGTEAKGDIVIAGHTDNVPIHGGPYQTNLKAFHCPCRNRGPVSAGSKGDRSQADLHHGVWRIPTHCRQRNRRRPAQESSSGDYRRHAPPCPPKLGKRLDDPQYSVIEIRENPSMSVG